jgi:hypothetical protein
MTTTIPNGSERPKANGIKPESLIAEAHDLVSRFVR